MSALSKFKSFTLIELLITIGILGILTSVVIVIVNPETQKYKSYDAILKRTMYNIASQIESYKTIEGTYPASPDLLSTYLSGFATDANDGFKKDGIYVGRSNMGTIYWYSTSDKECLNAVSNLDTSKYLRWQPGTGIFEATTMDGCGP